jgi:hypothetical protein
MHIKILFVILRGMTLLYCWNNSGGGKINSRSDTHLPNRSKDVLITAKRTEFRNNFPRLPNPEFT